MRTDEKWHYTQFSALLEYCEQLIALLHMEDAEERAKTAKGIEHKADSIVAGVVDRLRSTRRVPFEKRTVFNLAHNIDNVIDELEKAADRMKSYGVPLGEPGEEMLALLSKAVEEAKKAIFCLANKKLDKLAGHCLRIKTLESEADVVHRDAVAEISREKDRGIEKAFSNPEDTGAIVALIREVELRNRSHEIIEILESAFDQAQDVADFIEELRYALE